MSYILDALKKSEKERQKRTVPDPLEIHDYIARDTRKRRPAWAYLLAAVVIVNIGLLFYWMSPWQTKQTATGGVRSEERSTALNAPVPPAPLQPKTDAERAVMPEKENEPESPRIAAGKALQSVPPAGKSGNLQVAAAPAERAKETLQSSGPTESTPVAKEPRQVDHIAPAVSEQKAEPQAGAPDAGRIYTVSELPLSLQQRLPAFIISAFLYSDDPAARMVRVNGKMLREGDILAEGLKLNEIRQNELIFGYQNYRVRLGIQ